MGKRPNVLHIMADHLNASAVAAYGSKVCRTPHIDSLAAWGILFQNFYCKLLIGGRTAKVLGVTIPQSLLLGADNVIK